MKRFVALMLALMMLAGAALAEGALETGTDKVIVTDWMLTGNRFVMLFQNVTEETIPYFDVQVVVKDASGNIVETIKDGHDAVLPGSTVVTQKGYYGEVPEGFVLEVAVDTEKYTNNYINHAENLVIEGNANDAGKVFLQVTNNDEMEIDEIEIVVVYYAGEEIVGASEAETTHVAPGKTETLEFAAPTDASFHPVEYDTYQVFVNQAHTF